MDVTSTSSIGRDDTVIVIPYSDSRAEHVETWLNRVVPRLQDGGGQIGRAHV